MDKFKFKTKFAGEMEVSGILTLETMLPAHIVLYRLIYSEEHEGIDYKYKCIDREHMFLTTTDVMGKTMKYFIMFKKSVPIHKDKIFLDLVRGLQLKLYKVAYKNRKTSCHAGIRRRRRR